MGASQNSGRVYICFVVADWACGREDTAGGVCGVRGGGRLRAPGDQ